MITGSNMTSLFIVLVLGLVCVVTSTTDVKDISINPVVQKFREYVQIDTSKPENLYKAVEFWRREAASAGLHFRVIEPAGKPICIISVRGTDPSLPSIMLNSHMDVVPVEEKEWTYPPFSAYMDDDGNIFGRGTQDDKDVGIQYLEALKIIKQSGEALRRTFHITLMPDEETGGFEGIEPFVITTEFKDLNVGFALDEGLTSDDEVLYATYVNKRPWRECNIIYGNRDVYTLSILFMVLAGHTAEMRFTSRGKSGHGSTIGTTETAMATATKLMSKVMAFREVQKTIQASVPSTDYGAYTSVNVNIVHGGVVTNVIPAEVNVTVDMRLPTAADLNVYESLVQSWLSELNNGSTVEFLKKTNVADPTAVGDSNPYWTAILEAANEIGITIEPVVAPATSDMTVVRNLGIPAIGFSPKFNTTSKMHAENEYLNAKTLLKGVDVFVAILKKLGNLQ